MEYWELAKLPPGRKMVSCKWVFKLKVKADGTFDRYKARLVARGFSQVPRVDYLETFAPVMKLPTLRVLCAISAYKDYELQMFDVKTAFLNGKLHIEIYMQQPPCYEVKDKEDNVCKLNKTLYGLKQSAMAWNAVLDAELLAFGFTKSQADGSLYIYNKGDIVCYLAVYVDDLILSSNNSEFIIKVTDLLATKFKMSSLGPLQSCLGIHVQCNRKKRVITLSQPRYLLDSAEQLGLRDAKPAATP